MVKLNNLYHHEVDIYSLPGVCSADCRRRLSEKAGRNGAAFGGNAGRAEEGVLKFFKGECSSAV